MFIVAKKVMGIVIQRVFHKSMDESTCQVQSRFQNYKEITWEVFKVKKIPNLQPKNK
jgi:hypothetical protein